MSWTLRLQRGLKAVRYADDCIIFCRSKKVAERALAWITRFVEKKLFLKVNQKKTKILKIGDPEVQFLGFTFTTTVSRVIKRKFPKYKYFPRVHEKKRTKIKQELKTLLDRRAPGGIESIKRKLQQKLRGWYQYFERAIPISWMKELDSWIRRRVRQLLWKQWKTPQNHYAEFCKSNISTSVTRWILLLE